MRTSTMLASCLALGALLVSHPAQAADPAIVGSYAVAGANPGGKGQYQGSLTISKDGDTYHVKWSVGPDEYIGTGILREGWLAVAYTDTKGSWFGVAFYKISDGGRLLDGQWTMAGGKQIGTEKLTRQ